MLPQNSRFDFSFPVKCTNPWAVVTEQKSWNSFIMFILLSTSSDFVCIFVKKTDEDDVITKKADVRH